MHPLKPRVFPIQFLIEAAPFFSEMARYTPEGKMDQLTFQSVMDSAHAKFMLAKDLLAEVPIQVVEYMRENNFQPQVPQVPSVRSTAMTFEDMRLGP